MTAGVELVQHYAAEAMRLYGASRISDELREAERLLAWLLQTWKEPCVSLPDIYQYGPASIRDKARAHRVVTILEDHGWLVPAGRGETAGNRRRETWLIVRI
jgi:hypothetical protein